MTDAFAGRSAPEMQCCSAAAGKESYIHTGDMQGYTYTRFAKRAASCNATSSIIITMAHVATAQAQMGTRLTTGQQGNAATHTQNAPQQGLLRHGARTTRAKQGKCQGIDRVQQVALPMPAQHQRCCNNRAGLPRRGACHTQPGAAHTTTNVTRLPTDRNH